MHLNVNISALHALVTSPLISYWLRLVLVFVFRDVKERVSRRDLGGSMSQKTKTGKICKNLARNMYVYSVHGLVRIFCSVLQRQTCCVMLIVCMGQVCLYYVCGLLSWEPFFFLKMLISTMLCQATRLVFKMEKSSCFTCC